MSPAEVVANVLVTASIVLAARNSVHTWWTGILGCAVFAFVFAASKLYADTALQGFFIVASAIGWWHWLHGDRGAELPVRWTPLPGIAACLAAGAAFSALWAYGLATYTDAAAPIADATVLGFSVVAQLLMMGRRVENWIVWILVNSIAVPLFWSRGLHLTALLYGFYWGNAWWALARWRRLARPA